MSEKNTERYMQEAYDNVFNKEYSTNGNVELFGTKRPDGWDIINDKILIIIENKQLIRQTKEGKAQLFGYYDMLSDDVKNKYQVYLILALGKTKKSFKYIIYNNKNETNMTLNDIKNSLTEQPKFDVNEIHNLNQYLYDNQINLSKSEKTLFIASILICLKIDKDILSDYDEKTNSYVIAEKIIKTIGDYYNDNVFTEKFRFIKSSLNNKYLLHIFNMLKVDVVKYGKDILNQFYSEFCIWDRNNDASMGIVLTPDDIVKIMINKSFDYYKQFNNNDNIKFIDFCTGTGSFLIKASSFTKNLYGCEIGEERYALTKCNFILHDLEFVNVKRNSCFDEKYEKNSFDISVINPPFGKGIEREFVLYQIKLLKENGIGCCIIPRNNFNNNIDSVNNFKKTILSECQILEVINCNSKVFVPNASVECTIIIYCKNKKESNDVKIIDYSDDGYKINKGIRYYDHEPKINIQTRKLSFDDNWNYQKDFDSMINEQEIIKMIHDYNNDYQYAYNKYMINKKSYSHQDMQFIKYKLCDIIEPIKIKTYTYDKCEDGDIPFYVASQLNIPKGYKNVVSIDCNELGLTHVLCINKSGEGVVGHCHIREGRFGCNGLVGCYKMKIGLTIPNLALLQYQLIDKFNHHFTHISLKDIDETEICLFANEIKYDDIIHIKSIEYKPIKEWKKYKISDLMNLLPIKNAGNKGNTNDGEYLLISTGQQNNGLLKYVDKYEYDGTIHKYITVAMTGSSGSSFYQPFKFLTSDRVRVLEIKEDVNINPHLIALMMNNSLIKKYSYSNGLSINKLLNEEIDIPIFE